MSIQQDAQLGIKAETTFGTAATVDQFVEYSSESFDRKPVYAVSSSLRPGMRVARGRRRVLVKEDAAGSLTFEAPTRGLGTFLKAALGAVTNTAVVGDATVFQQVHTPAVDDLAKSYTIQKGLPLLAGAVQPMTFLGCMCEALSIDFGNSAIVTISTDWVAREVKTDVALATATYPLADLFTFVHGAITLGGTVTPPTATALASGGTAVANIVSGSVKWENALDGGGWNLGGAGRRSRAAALGQGKIGGQIVAEYDSNVLRDAYMAGTPLAMVLTFQHSGTIGTASKPTLQVVIPSIYLEGELPKTNNGAPIQQSIGITGLDPEVAGTKPIYVVYRSLDTTV